MLLDYCMVFNRGKTWKIAVHKSTSRLKRGLLTLESIKRSLPAMNRSLQNWIWSRRQVLGRRKQPIAGIYATVLPILCQYRRPVLVDHDFYIWSANIFLYLMFSTWPWATELGGTKMRVRACVWLQNHNSIVPIEKIVNFAF